ncbi:ExbD/TolR family protein, partial [Brevundimonas denitrificans]
MIRSGDAYNRDEEAGSLFPDLTTLLDILFILLVFFILTAGAVYRSLDLTLPEAVSEQPARPAETRHILLEIRASGYALDGQAFADLPALKDGFPRLLKEKPDYELIVAGDQSISLERLL